MKDVHFKSVVYQLKSQTAREVLRQEIAREVRRLGYILLSSKGFTRESESFLRAEGMAIFEIKPYLFLVCGCLEQVTFHVQNSPRSSEEIADKLKKAFEEQFGATKAPSIRWKSLIFNVPPRIDC